MRVFLCTLVTLLLLWVYSAEAKLFPDFDLIGANIFYKVNNAPEVRKFSGLDRSHIIAQFEIAELKMVSDCMNYTCRLPGKDRTVDCDEEVYSDLDLLAKEYNIFAVAPLKISKQLCTAPAIKVSNKQNDVWIYERSDPEETQKQMREVAKLAQQMTPRDAMKIFGILFYSPPGVSSPDLSIPYIQKIFDRKIYWDKKTNLLVDLKGVRGTPETPETAVYRFTNPQTMDSVIVVMLDTNWLKATYDKYRKPEKWIPYEDWFASQTTIEGNFPSIGKFIPDEVLKHIYMKYYAKTLTTQEFSMKLLTESQFLNQVLQQIRDENLEAKLQSSQAGDEEYVQNLLNRLSSK